MAKRSCIRCGCAAELHTHQHTRTYCAGCSCLVYRRWFTPADLWWTTRALAEAWWRMS